MTHCPTCNDTRRIRIGNKHVQCPICRKPAPEPIDLIITCRTTTDLTEPIPGPVHLRANGVEISEILDQITPEQIVNHYGAEKLLDRMMGWEIREYMPKCKCQE